jgi:uncharacterized protein
VPLSPFDSLIWHRPRSRRLFGIGYVLEAYKPPANRECGYFGMPVLRGSSIAGRVAIRRRGGYAYLEGYQLEPGHDPGCLRRALQQAARWMAVAEIDDAALKN